MHVDPAVAVPLPAVEARAAEGRIAWAEYPVVGPDAGLQRRQRDHHLEGGAGSVEPGNGLVRQRVERIVDEVVPLLDGEAGVEEIRSSEERGVGKRCVSSGIYRWSPYI